MTRATADDLQRFADFDRVFVVTQRGELADAPAGIHAPEVWHVDGASSPDDVEILGDSAGAVNASGWGRAAWRPLTGYTGQHGYNGAAMHASEYLGGKLAADILETPGVYVVTAVECHPVDDDPEPEPAGWVVLRLEHADYPHDPGRLYDCPVCESLCHCLEGDAPCVYSGEHTPAARCVACGVDPARPGLSVCRTCDG